MSAPKRKRKTAIIALVSLALAVVIAFGAMKARGGDKKEPQLPVKVGKAEVADIQVKVTEVGTVQPEVKVDVKSAISGKVVDIIKQRGAPASQQLADLWTERGGQRVFTRADVPPGHDFIHRLLRDAVGDCAIDGLHGGVEGALDA